MCPSYFTKTDLVWRTPIVYWSIIWSFLYVKYQYVIVENEYKIRITIEAFSVCGRASSAIETASLSIFRRQQLRMHCIEWVDSKLALHQTLSPCLPQDSCRWLEIVGPHNRVQFCGTAYCAAFCDVHCSKEDPLFQNWWTHQSRVRLTNAVAAGSFGIAFAQSKHAEHTGARVDQNEGEISSVFHCLCWTGSRNMGDVSNEVVQPKALRDLCIFIYYEW